MRRNSSFSVFGHNFGKRYHGSLLTTMSQQAQGQKQKTKGARICKNIVELLG